MPILQSANRNPYRAFEFESLVRDHIPRCPVWDSKPYGFTCGFPRGGHLNKTEEGGRGVKSVGL